jgi:hypothetical protein
MRTPSQERAMSEDDEEKEADVPEGAEREELAQRGRIQQTEQEEDEGPAAA